jgi:SAM-dependent methyltransferase
VRYEPDRATAFYDEYGEREWTRFDDGRSSPLSPAVHANVLRRFVRAGDRVLDVGAGPGRFTIELARLGATVVASDLSPVQLELNRAKLSEVGLAEHVEEWVRADITDLNPLRDGEFDAVVCFGGPLSYVLDRADEAVDELLRVVRPGGHVLVSVMSLIGSIAHVPYLVSDFRAFGKEAVQGVIDSGDLPPTMSGGHLAMHLYRWSELAELLRRHPCEIVAAYSSGLANGRLHHQLLADISDAERDALTDWAIQLAGEPGAIDMGEHIIAVVRKRSEGA